MPQSRNFRTEVIFFHSLQYSLWKLPIWGLLLTLLLRSPPSSNWLVWSDMPLPNIRQRSHLFTLVLGAHLDALFAIPGGNGGWLVVSMGACFAMGKGGRSAGATGTGAGVAGSGSCVSTFAKARPTSPLCLSAGPGRTMPDRCCPIAP